MADYDKAIEIHTNYALAYFNRGNLNLDTKNLTGALSDYTTAIDIKPDSATYNNRAIVFLEMNMLDKAIEDANTAIKLNTKDKHPYDTRGQIYMAMNQDEKALNDLDHAISLDSNYYEALTNRAKCYRKLAEIEENVDKKSDYISKAEDDEKKAQSLKEEKNKKNP